MSDIVEQSQSGASEFAELSETNMRLRARVEELENLFTHEGVDAFWRVWNEIGEPHIHGVYESTWAAFRAAIGGET